VAEPPSTRWLALIAGLLFLNTLLLVGLWLRVGTVTVTGEEPRAKVLGVEAPTEAAVRPAAAGPSAGVQGGALDAVFASLIAPLEQAVSDLDGDRSAVLPTDADVAAAVASGRLDSPESRAVLETLEDGYAAHNMPFPELGRP
jgi:hypothetical protein